MWELVPNKSVPEIKRNPYKARGKELTPAEKSDIFCNNREALISVYSQDVKRLKRAFDDTSNISNPMQQFGIGCEDNVLRAVVKSQNYEMFKMVID